MIKLSNIKFLIWSSPLFLTACFDDSASQCKSLLNDEAKQSLAFSYCEKSANNGDADSQLYFAELLLKENNIKKAVDFLEKSANQKNRHAIYKLAELYETGALGRANLDKAAFYYEESCKKDELKACERFQSLKKVQNEKEKADAIALEQAKAQTLAQEKAKLDAQAKAEEQQRLNEEAKQRKAEIDELKMRTKGRKFYYGLAKYKDGNLWGHINNKGEIVIQPQWIYAADFYDGLAAVQTAEGKWGYIDTSGNYQIYPRFSCVVYFSEGLAAVTETGYGKDCQGGKWGFIDKSGKWVIPPVLDSVETVFKNGIAKVSYNQRMGYINKQAQWVDYQE